MPWYCKTFEELTTNELYHIMKVRQEVFVVEQKAAYLDADGSDQEALHLFKNDDAGIIAYARIVPQGIKYPHVSFGRVLTMPRARGTLYGRRDQISLGRTWVVWVESFDLFDPIRPKCYTSLECLKRWNE